MATPARAHWLDRLTAPVAPIWTLKRQKARIVADLAQRRYEAAAPGRRTQGWNRVNTDGNAANAVWGGLAYVRATARDLVRNNPYAASALATIVDHTVGWGITAKALPASPRLQERWNVWANSTACDADGQRDLVGLEKLVVRTVVEAGEVLVRRRPRLPQDGLPIPLQLQVLEPDLLDASRDVAQLPNGGRIVQGIELDALGRRVAYWMFREHPGGSRSSPASYPVAAADILHIGKPGRPGQMRSVSWFAPVLLRFKDFDELEDATLMKQKIAACLAVFVTDLDGGGAPLGRTSADAPLVETVEPGMITYAPAGRDVKVVEPPSTTDYPTYAVTVLRAIATGLGVTYEDLTGDYTGMPFSAARMSRLRHWARVEDWRWSMLVPQFCDPVWQWAMAAASMEAGVEREPIPQARWSAPPMPMIEPDKEGLAHMRNVRAGIITMPAVIRERGEDPDEVLEEMREWNEKLDAAGVVLDSDPRRMTQAGQVQGSKAATEPVSDKPAPPPAADEQ